MFLNYGADVISNTSGYWQSTENSFSWFFFSGREYELGENAGSESSYSRRRCLRADGHQVLHWGRPRRGLLRANLGNWRPLEIHGRHRTRPRRRHEEHHHKLFKRNFRLQVGMEWMAITNLLALECLTSNRYSVRWIWLLRTQIFVLWKIQNDHHLPDCDRLGFLLTEKYIFTSNRFLIKLTLENHFQCILFHEYRFVSRSINKQRNLLGISRSFKLFRRRNQSTFENFLIISARR